MSVPFYSLLADVKASDIPCLSLSNLHSLSRSVLAGAKASDIPCLSPSVRLSLVRRPQASHACPLLFAFHGAKASDIPCLSPSVRFSLCEGLRHLMSVPFCSLLTVRRPQTSHVCPLLTQSPLFRLRLSWPNEGPAAGRGTHLWFPIVARCVNATRFGG
jgi:hypothetical protein